MAESDDLSGPPDLSDVFAEGELPGVASGAAVPARGRSRGIYLLVFVNVALAIVSFYATRVVAATEEYALNESAEIGADLEAALAGLFAMRAALYVSTAGFAASALGALSLTRIGLRVQILWAVLLSLSILGLLYGLPVLVYSLHPATRARFGPPATAAS